jgi:hypothetical protein
VRVHHSVIEIIVGLPFLGATKGSPEASNQLVDLANGV